MNDDHKKDDNKWFGHSEYKIIGNDADKTQNEITFKYDDEIILPNSTHSVHELYKVFIKNKKLFGIEDYIPLQHIETTNYQTFTDEINDNLTDVNNHTIKLINIVKINEKYHQHILKCKYALLCNATENQIKPAKMIKDDHYIYEFDNVDHVQLLMPFQTDVHGIGLYVQPQNQFDFVLFKKFYPKYSLKTQQNYNEINYLLNVLQNHPNKIQSAADFFKKIGFKRTDLLVMVQPIKKILTELTDKESTKLLLNRFIYELKINEFPNLSLLYEDEHS
eukprot:204468_1